MANIDPLGLDDFYAGLGAELATPVGGGKVGIGLVLDSDDIFASGIYLSANVATGAHVAYGPQAGWAPRDIEGDGYSSDNNMMRYSPEIMFDEQGFNGVEFSSGRGKGGSVSVGRTDTLNLRTLGFGRPRHKTLPQVRVSSDSVCEGWDCVAEQDPVHEDEAQPQPQPPSISGGGRESGRGGGNGGGGPIASGCYGNCGGGGGGHAQVGAVEKVQE